MSNKTSTVIWFRNIKTEEKLYAIRDTKHFFGKFRKIREDSFFDN